MTPGDLTVVVLTRDEAHNLARALGSAPAGARALVLDAESTDGTAALARSLGAEVIVRPWSGFVAARRFALAAVTTPWTLMLDADEALDATLRDALAALEPACAGYRMRRATFFCGKAIVGGAWGDEAPLRLFRTAEARLVAHSAAGGSAELHEAWEVDGREGLLPGRILHHSYPTWRSYWVKFDRYTSTEAAALGRDPRAALRVAALAPLRALWLFTRRGGFRDGWRGAAIALGSALYPVVAHVKALRR